MVPLLAGTLLSLAPHFAQGALGLAQGVKAGGINPQRPDYKMPGEIGQNTQMYNALANSNRLPGQSIMENRLNAGVAGGLNEVNKTGGSSVNRLAAITSLNESRNNAVNDLGVQGAVMRLQNMDKLANARGIQAQYRDQEFDYNKNQPYELELMRRRALQEAGLANTLGAADGMSGVGGQLLGLKSMGV